VWNHSAIVTKAHARNFAPTRRIIHHTHSLSHTHTHTRKHTQAHTQTHTHTHLFSSHPGIGGEAGPRGQRQGRSHDVRPQAQRHFRGARPSVCAHPHFPGGFEASSSVLFLWWVPSPFICFGVRFRKQDVRACMFAILVFSVSALFVLCG